MVPLFEEQIPFGRTNKSAKRDKPEPRPQDARDLFGEFWKAYPKHVARGAARTAWDKAIKNGADPEEVILGARAYASSPRRRDSDSKFTAHPATWLNHERWADEPEPAPSAAPGRTTNQHHESRAGAQLAEVFN